MDQQLQLLFAHKHLEMTAFCLLALIKPSMPRNLKIKIVFCLKYKCLAEREKSELCCFIYV